MSLRVGINRNVFLEGATINDKQSLVISFRDGNAVVSNEDDFLNKASGVKAGSGTTNIMIFPVNTTDTQGKPREVENIAKDLRSVREQLEHLLLGYVTSDRATLSPYVGIDTSDAATFTAQLQDQASVDKMFQNLTTQFVQKVQELKDQLPVKAFRLLLIRRSATNHYGTFRRMFITDNPFWELESVPFEATRLGFTKYEKGKGLDKGEPVTQAQAADSVPTGGDATSAILGSR